MKKRIIGLWIAAAVMLAVIAGCSVAGQPQVASVSITSASTTPTTKTTAKPPTTRTTPPTTVTSTSELPRTVTAVSTAQVTTSVVQWAPPAGFDDWGGEIGARFAEDSAYNCPANVSQCTGIEVYTEYGCSPSVYVAVDVVRGDGSFVTTLNTLTSALAPHSQTIVVLGLDDEGTDLKAQIKDVHCQVN